MILFFLIRSCCELPSIGMNSVGYLNSVTEVGRVFLKICYSFEELEILCGWRQCLFTMLLRNTMSECVLSNHISGEMDDYVVLLFATARMSSELHMNPVLLLAA